MREDESDSHFSGSTLPSGALWKITQIVLFLHLFELLSMPLEHRVEVFLNRSCGKPVWRQIRGSVSGAQTGLRNHSLDRNHDARVTRSERATARTPRVRHDVLEIAN